MKKQILKKDNLGVGHTISYYKDPKTYGQAQQYGYTGLSGRIKGGSHGR
jgi:hypothetical protein